MRKLFLLFVVLLATTLSYAFQIGNLYYNITLEAEFDVEYIEDDAYEFQISEGEVEVTNGDYSNLISASIPSRISHYGATYKVTAIGEEAFTYCSSLTSIAIPNSVNSIGGAAFCDCSSLSSIVLPNNIDSIEQMTFMGCTSLTSLNIPNGVMSIGESAFYSSALTAITIPEGVTEIGLSAFSGCHSLAIVILPNSLKKIGGYAFHGSLPLTSITIPKSVINIGNSAFAGCPSLESIVVEEGNTVYNSGKNCNAIIETNTNTIIAGCQNTVIPNSVKCIGEYAFYFCSSPTSITIPNSVTSIERYAFAGCYSLSDITIPNSVTLIGDYAFAVSGLTSIHISESVEEIGARAFGYCQSLSTANIFCPDLGSGVFVDCINLSSISIGSSTKFGGSTFRGCYLLNNIYCYSPEPNSIYGDPFENYDANLYVPCNSLVAYQSHEIFGLFDNIRCIKAEDDELPGGDDFELIPDRNIVTVVWPVDSNATTYTIEIRKNELLCRRLIFDADGHLLNIAFAQGRNGNNPAQYATNTIKGLRFTITGLEAGTNYTCSIITKDEEDNELSGYSGEFRTLSDTPTSLDNITTTNANIPKILRNGQLLILRDGKTYNAMGQEM